MRLDSILILDTETTGLDAAIDNCIEIAVVTYSIPDACVLNIFSTLFLSENGNPLQKVNHIPSNALKKGMEPNLVWGVIEEYAKKCDAVVAHNALFDKDFVRGEAVHKIPWICTQSGVTWPLQTKSEMSLVNLVLAHGLAVVDPHRALNDCMLIARLLSRCAELGHDIQKILSRGLRPMAVFQAMVSYNDRELAKNAGFHWDAGNKRWIKTMAVEDVEDLAFKVREIATSTNGVK